MPRRVSLPAADDLFRPTARAEELPAAPSGGQSAGQDPGAAQVAVPRQAPRPVAAVPEPTTDDARARRSSGRVRHDEKMTVYVTADELLDIEHARLDLRRRHGLGVDRGRIVRAAIAMALADLEAQGSDSPLVQRLLDE